jgi:hypothetical protein
MDERHRTVAGHDPHPLHRPSGYDDATVLTAAEVRIVDRAMRLQVFASIVATPSVTLPVAGTVHNTDTLLRHNGFVGVKTGSTAAAGSCFAFRAIRRIDGTRTTITGVVLGQPGPTCRRRVWLPPTPWSTASPVIELRPDLGQPTFRHWMRRGSRHRRHRRPGRGDGDGYVRQHEELGCRYPGRGVARHPPRPS